MGIDSVRNARKESMESDEAWALISGLEEVIATKGRSKILRWTPNDETKAEILDAVIGRSGTLRAPTIRMGGRLLVGFDEATMTELIQ